MLDERHHPAASLAVTFAHHDALVIVRVDGIQQCWAKGGHQGDALMEGLFPKQLQDARRLIGKRPFSISSITIVRCCGTSGSRDDAPPRRANSEARIDR